MKARPPRVGHASLTAYEFAQLGEARGTGKAILQREKPAEKPVETVDRLEENIKAFKL